MEWMCLHDKLIVRRAAAKEEFAPGIVAPEAHRKAQNVGTVVATGTGRLVAGSLMALPLTIQPGMVVLFSAFAGVPLEGDDPDLVILREDEILAFKPE